LRWLFLGGFEGSGDGQKDKADDNASNDLIFQK